MKWWQLFYTGFLTVIFSIINFNTSAQRNPYKPSQHELVTPLKSGTFNAGIKSGGLIRTFQIYVPKNYNPAVKVPVVIMLHGFGGNAQNALEQGKWKEKAEKEGFIAIGLDGTLKKPGRKERFLGNQRSWNSGSNETPADHSNTNDVGFIGDMIDMLIAKNIADANRIYLTGFSNGAAMTFRAGVELSEKIAAIAPASSKIFVKANSLKHPLPLIYFYGSDDPLNPINGGEVKKLGVVRNLPPISETLLTWKSLLDCPTDKKEIYNKNGVTAQAYADCKEGSEIILYVVQGMGHCWAGGKNFLPKSIIGNPSDAINQTDVVWDFFKKHPKRN